MNSQSELLSKAEELLKPSLFKRVLGGGPDYDEAAGIFMKVANAYKLQKDWKNAELTFLRAAEVSELAEDKVQAANLYVEAGHCRMKLSESSASSAAMGSAGDIAEAYNKACDIYTSGGRFGQAGRIMKTLAEQVEKQGHPEKALVYWSRAVEFYEHDEFSQTARAKALEQYVNGLALYKEDYATCLTRYEEMADSHLSNKLLQYQAKEFFFQAILMSILKTKDVITTRILLTEFVEKDPSRFGQSREKKLCAAILDSIEHDDSTEFTQALTDFANITPLDEWKTTILSRIKQSMFTQKIQDGLVPAAVENLAGEIDLT